VMKKGRFILLMLVLFGSAVLVGCNGTNPVKSDIFKDPLVVTQNPTQFQKLEIALYEKEETIAQDGNPYDYDYFKVMGEFTSPSGSVINIPGFWYQHTSIYLNEADQTPPYGISGVASTNPEEPQGREVVFPVGSPHYRFRLLPTEAGSWTYKLKIFQNNTQTETLSGNFNVSPSEDTYQGVIKVDESNKRTFVYENGDSFVPVGQNLAWYTSSTRRSVDYDVWFANMANVGMNIARIWLATWGFALHWGGYDNFSSRYSHMARLDRVVELAENFAIKIMLVLLNHGQFSSIVNPEWERNPWNVANGGILEHPLLFFTTDEAKRVYKNQLLYLIARYSYTQSLLCWELFNEVDYVDGAAIGSLVVKNWHDEMAKFLKAHDPYQHMVTTSYKGSTGSAFNLSSIDFATMHSYDYAEKGILNNLPQVLNNVFAQYNKPVLQAELGINWQNGAASHRADPNGISIRQGLWAGIMGGGAGGAMNWWWDSQVHPNNLYYLYQGAATFASKMNLSGSDYTQLTELSGVNINKANIRYLGYRFNNRVYGYLYDGSWTHRNFQNILTKDGLIMEIPFTNGIYTITYFDPLNGNIIEQNELTVNSGKVEFITPSFQYDMAFIIE
jgi:hypothetical protein